VVLHKAEDSSQYSCATIKYDVPTVAAKATFEAPLVGSVVFTQPQGQPAADTLILLDAEFADKTTTAEGNQYSIVESCDDQKSFNPFK